jgi:hypothetical protein
MERRMRQTRVIVLLAVVAFGGPMRPASADWLLTGHVGSLFNVKTEASSEIFVPAEKFDNSIGFGVNLASAFPTRGNLGFELDLSVYPKALENSDVFGDAYESGLMTISTNFFYSPFVPVVRPYFSVGPNFGYRFDGPDTSLETPSGWAVGVNAGAGLIAFATRRVGGRVDVRYYRNFGDFYDLREDALNRRTGWSNLQFIRVFVGITAVL